MYWLLMAGNMSTVKYILIAYTGATEHPYPNCLLLTKCIEVFIRSYIQNIIYSNR